MSLGAPPSKFTELNYRENKINSMNDIEKKFSSFVYG